MIKTLIFDLDDTLLVNPIDQFLPPYFKALTAYLATYVPADRLVPELLRATRLMMANRDPQHTNEQVFAAAFYPALGLDETAMRPILAEFYEREFPTLREYTQVNPEARSLLAAAQAHGYDFAIATNPVFPLRAIQHRLDWAGVGDFPFRFITSYETMHFTKPHVEYYHEIFDHIGRAADECVMVGNEIENDIRPAKAVGMRTFFVTGEGEAISDEVASLVDDHGSLGDLRRLIERREV